MSGAFVTAGREEFPAMSVTVVPATVAKHAERIREGWRSGDDTAHLKAWSGPPGSGHKAIRTPPHGTSAEGSPGENGSAGRWRSSSAPRPRRASACYPGAEWSSAPSLGSDAAAASPGTGTGTGRKPSRLPQRGRPQPVYLAHPGFLQRADIPQGASNELQRCK